ncbi:9119_t:CDS:2, partial [Entrophospora sp. SA101]
NNFNKYVLCLYCRNALGHEVAYQNKLLNKKDRIKSHLKKCENFKVVVGELNINQILEEEIHPNSQKRAQSILEDHLLRITVSNGLAFRWIESEEVKSLFRWLNPNIRLPNRKALSGRILNDASLKHNSWIKEQASNSEYGVTVALDGWSNVVNEKILGVILITNEGETLVWNAYDISGERSRTQEVLQHITLIFEDLQSKNIMINAVVTDSAAEYAAARRQLHVQHTDKVFIPCFAHQVNLCIGEIFKESYRMKLVAKDAVAIASYFNNVNHAYWIKRLRDEQMDLYRNTYGLVSPNDTRWNSNYDCYVSLLRSKGALKTLVTKYQATRNLRTNERSFVLSDDLCQIISNEEWWEDVEELKDLMKPFARCLDKLQADKAQLHDVILSFGYFVQIYKNHHDQEFAARMINRIEKRWNSWEQTLLIISIFLHPTLKDTTFNDSIPNLTWVDLGRWIAYYYV